MKVLKFWVGNTSSIDLLQTSAGVQVKGQCDKSPFRLCADLPKKLYLQEPLGADFCYSSVTVAVLPTPTQALRQFSLQEPLGASRSKILLELCDNSGVTNSYPGFAPIRPPGTIRSLQEPPEASRSLPEPLGASRSRLLLELCDSSAVTQALRRFGFQAPSGASRSL